MHNRARTAITVRKIQLEEAVAVVAEGSSSNMADSFVIACF